MRVLVTGASGFVGRHVTAHLLRQGHQVMALSRRGEAVEGARGIKGDIVNDGSLAAVMSQVEAVIHLVGIIRERGQATFKQVHIEGTRNVVTAAGIAGVERFVHMSALGAQKGSESHYFDSKARAEEIVRRSGLHWTIHRPSLIFGKGDNFFGRVLKNLVGSGPVIPQIGDGHFLFRPVWVGDVARAFAQSLDSPATIGEHYDLVGPSEYSLRELLLLMREAMSSKKPLLPVPLVLMRLALPLLQILPNPPITYDEFNMLLSGNTASPREAQLAFDLVMEKLPNRLPEILEAAY